MTGGLLPISSPWRQALWDPRPVILFSNWTLAVIVTTSHPLWREDRSVVYNCCCLRQRSHSQVWVPRGSWPHFTVSDLRLPQPGGPGPLFISPRNRVARLYPQTLG
jgi:hypothetical protein